MAKKIAKKETKKETKKDAKKEVKKSSDKTDAIRLRLLKDFGVNAVVKGGDLEKCLYGRIPTGSVYLDVKLGGGIPIGKITQISGNKSDGKSTLADFIIKNAQTLDVKWVWTKRSYDKGRESVEQFDREENGIIVGYLDLEGTKDVYWSKEIGVDTDEVVYAPPSGAEEAFNMAHTMQLAGVGLIVLDSVDALVTMKEYDKDFGESSQMGGKQKLMGDFLRKFVATNIKLTREGKLPCTLILINQVREKIGVMYGSPEFTPGGRAIGFYSAIDLRLRRGDWLIEGSGAEKRIVGQVIKFKTEKNKTFKQQQTGDFDFYFDDTYDSTHKKATIDNSKELVILGIELGIIEKSGSWFRYKGENLAQGAENTVKHLMYNKDKYEKIKEEIFKVLEDEKEGLDL